MQVIMKGMDNRTRGFHLDLSSRYIFIYIHISAKYYMRIKNIHKECVCHQ